MQVSAEMQSAWTELWNTGHFDSLPQDRAAGLLVALDAAWAKFFFALPEGGKLLDLATGGGEVIRAAIAAGRQPKISGVDIADLAAVSASFENRGVTLIGNTDLSALPFSDAAFDGVASQFGLEYAEVGAATREAVRVLAPGGHGQLVLHHAESAITKGVSNSLAADRQVFGDGSVFRLGRAVFQLRRRSAGGSTEETEFRSAVTAIQSRLGTERAFAPARNVVGRLTQLATSPASYPSDAVIRELEAMEEQLRSRTLRKQAQMDAALDQKGIAKLASCLASAGAVVGQPEELRYPMGRLMAWSLSFHK